MPILRNIKKVMRYNMNYSREKFGVASSLRSSTFDIGEGNRKPVVPSHKTI